MTQMLKIQIDFRRFKAYIFPTLPLDLEVLPDNFLQNEQARHDSL